MQNTNISKALFDRRELAVTLFTSLCVITIIFQYYRYISPVFLYVTHILALILTVYCV